MKHIWAPSSIFSISASDSSAAALPISAREPAPSPPVVVAAELEDAVGGRIAQRLGVGIGGDEVDALDAAADHVGDGVAAGAADADHRDARAQFVQFRCNLDHVRHLLWGPGPPATPRLGR